MLLGGFAVMVLADIVLVLAKAPWHVFVGYLIVGVHMSMTQGNMKAVLSATMPQMYVEQVLLFQLYLRV